MKTYSKHLIDWLRESICNGNCSSVNRKVLFKLLLLHILFRLLYTVSTGHGMCYRLDTIFFLDITD